jgi:hypothetical protein
VRVTPRGTVGAISVSGLRRGDEVLTLSIDRTGEVTAASGGAVAVG